MGGERTIITMSDEDKWWFENCGISMQEAIRRGIAGLRDRKGGRA